MSTSEKSIEDALREAANAGSHEFNRAQRVVRSEAELTVNDLRIQRQKLKLETATNRLKQAHKRAMDLSVPKIAAQNRDAMDAYHAALPETPPGSREELIHTIWTIIRGPNDARVGVKVRALESLARIQGWVKPNGEDNDDKDSRETLGRMLESLTESPEEQEFLRKLMVRAASRARGGK